MIARIKKAIQEKETKRINYIYNGNVFYQSVVRCHKYFGFVRYANHVRATIFDLSIKYEIPEKDIHACNTI